MHLGNIILEQVASIRMQKGKICKTSRIYDHDKSKMFFIFQFIYLSFFSTWRTTNDKKVSTNV